MNRRNIYWIISGIVNLFTALLHTIGGQIDLVNPLVASNLKEQAKSEWIGVWHVITIILFASSFYLLKNGFGKNVTNDTSLINSIGILYCLISIPFILSSIYFQTLAPQWIILLPIGILTLIGHKREKMTL